MKQFSKLILGTLCLMASKFAFASNPGPSLNASCPYSIETPTNGTGVFFNESCTVAYVLPPKSGQAEIAALARTTNLQFCPEVKEVHRISKKTIDSIATIADKIEKMIIGFEPLEKEVIELQQSLAQKRAHRVTARQSFEQAEKQLEELRQTEREARKFYRDCLLDNEMDSSICAIQKSEWDEVKNEFNEFRRGEYRIKRDATDSAEQEFLIISESAQEMSRRYSEAIAPMLELQERLMDLNIKAMELYTNYVRLEGATGQIIWTIRWDELLQEYRRLNSKMPIRFMKILMTEAQLTSSAKFLSTSSANIELASIAAIKSAVIPGAKPTGILGMGNGDKVTGAQLQPSPPNDASIVFGNGISGQIVLTLVGACPYFDGIDNRNKIDARDLASHMVANLVYSYEVAAKRGYSVTYNLSNLLRKIEAKSKRGGFFSTDAAHEIAESSDSIDWCKIDFSANSKDFQYSSEEQAQLSVTIKNELIDRAMKQFSILNAGASTPGSVPDFVESGAYRSSAELRKCYIGYCQVASAVLGVADSIWGNSAATASFYRNNNAWASERLSGIQFVSRSGALTFKPE